eukprot:1140286-Pelagomonas_calceolata.AAC.4
MFNHEAIPQVVGSRLVGVVALALEGDIRQLWVWGLGLSTQSIIMHWEIHGGFRSKDIKESDLLFGLKDHS